MELEKIQSIIESILFAAGRMVSIEEIELALEVSRVDLEKILEKMQEEYKEEKRGIESYIAVGLEYGNNPHQGKNPDEAFPFLYEYLLKDR